MSKNRLPIHEALSSTTNESLDSNQGSGMITMPLHQFLPDLLAALMERRKWLDDFLHDPVTISRDLHEVLLVARELQQRKCA